MPYLTATSHLPPFPITIYFPGMKQKLNDSIASYTTWRKGVLMIAPLEILLILVVAGLLVMTIIVSLASTAGKYSIAALKAHLQGLQTRMADPGTLNAEAEREDMEVLLNKVKATCEERDISRNMELKALLGQAHTTMDAIDKGQNRQRGSWLQFKGVTNSFYELYFPVVAK
jgi:hypothetical protein